MLSVLEIGEKIAVLRKIENLSQAQLANLLAVSAQAVGKWERGESMPDIIAFQKLAEVLGVDLNYFGDKQSESGVEQEAAQSSKMNETNEKDEPFQRASWNMSGSNWVDADFSGLCGLADKFNGANIEKCRFVGSELSGLSLKRNNIENSDFTSSNLRECRFANVNIEKDIFIECDFSKSEFNMSNIKNCDFSRANLIDIAAKWSNFQKIKLTEAIINGVSFQFGQLTDMTIDGEIANCSFENCDFARVIFDGAIIRNTFFKNSKLKRVKFLNCKADRLSYAFMKSSKADMSDVEIIEDL